MEDFAAGTIAWEIGDEGEEACIYVEGTVQNNASVVAGVQLMATAYSATGALVGTLTY